MVHSFVVSLDWASCTVRSHSPFPCRPRDRLGGDFGSLMITPGVLYPYSFVRIGCKSHCSWYSRFTVRLLVGLACGTTRAPWPQSHCHIMAPLGVYCVGGVGEAVYCLCGSSEPSWQWGMSARCSYQSWIYFQLSTSGRFWGFMGLDGGNKGPVVDGPGWCSRFSPTHF